MGSVLVVDDIAGNGRLLESLLAPDEHVVRTAGDGEEAVLAVHNAPPDLVLMDVMMPKADGFESRPRYRGRADDFVSKPFNAPELRARVRPLRNVRPIVRHHHERLDGSGYPDGLRDEAIPLLAQTMGIVDVFDALTRERPYKAALPFAQAAEELRGEAVRGWRRADLVATFLEQVARC